MSSAESTDIINKMSSEESSGKPKMKGLAGVSSVFVLVIILVTITITTIPDDSEYPGIGFQPLNRESRIDSNTFVLQYVDDNRVVSEANGEGDLNIDYARRAELFLEVYMNDVDYKLNYTRFDLDQELGDCGTFPYGFVNGDQPIKPCIFLKFNKIWEWDPKPIDDTDFTENSNWPSTFKDHFDSLPDQNQIFVDCQGRYSADQEAMKVGMTYVPSTQGFPAKYFPYKGNKEAYHPPLVAVQFHTSRMEDYIGQLIHIECRAYYKGVVHNQETKTGKVQFEVLLERKLQFN